jgi:propanediol dehydratase small subunit
MTDQETLRTATGRTLDELDMQAVLSGRLTPDDFRISAETLRHQAQAAEQAGYRQLAENFRRAAELTSISNEQVFRIYAMLRPGRATYDELVALAEQLERSDAPLNAALVREAAQVYLDRGLIVRRETGSDS